MASSGMKMKLLCMGLLMCMVLIAPHAEAAIPCNAVYSALYPCVSFVMGTGPLQQSCCSGIKNLYAAATTTPDRQSVCSCLKQVASSATGVDLKNAEALPGKCGVNLPFKIAPTIDCAQVH